MEIKMESYKILLPILLLLTFLAFTSTSASAQVLYDNGTGTTGYGYFADAGNPPYTDANPTFSEAGDVFTAGVSGTVTSIDFSGLYYGGTPPTSDSFVLSLYSTSAGAPATLIKSTTFTTASFSQTAVGTHDDTENDTFYTVYQFSGQLQSSLSLTAGTTYYFGISDLTDPYEDFAVAISDPASTPAGASDQEYSLEAGTSNTFKQEGPDVLAFQLKGEAVPEPNAGELLLLGGLGLFLARTYARRSQRA